MGLTRITSDGITDGSIVNADLHNSAAIAKTKLASLDIVNADVNASAAIAGSKISPDFGSQNIVTTGDLSCNDITLSGGNPEIFFTDNDANPDYRLHLNNGLFQIHDQTNNATRFQINTDGHVDIAYHLDVGNGLDVTGNITVSGTVDGRDVATDGTKLDGIESSATADQTSTEIKSLLASDNLTASHIADQAITLAKLEHGTSSNDGKFLRANNGADPTFETVASAEVYGFNTDSNGNLIVTTTNGGVDNISGTAYDAFDEVVFAATGFTFSVNASGNLIATI